MKILLVEDDHFQVEEFRDVLEEAFPNVEIEAVDSEHSFYRVLDGIEDNPPNIIIMDVMLRWAHPSPEMPEASEEVITGKHYRAGFRCLKRLAESGLSRKINVILYTVLQPDDIKIEVDALPPNVTYLVKESNYHSFIRTVRILTANR